ncbi:hypothetical protein [Dyella sp. C11]|uniref:hypothetical protein n=1 Tax=Dyella sp. C11 TaxID=2126991 RepID=UPI000D64B304|nr:hypothetical protein [Dyella sp. C11]
MAVHDHTAPARPDFPRGDAFSDLPVRRNTAHGRQAHSLHLSNLDDVALALYSLERLRSANERCRKAQAWGFPVSPPEWPFSAFFSEGLTTAIQCLNQYARHLEYGKARTRKRDL